MNTITITGRLTTDPNQRSVTIDDEVRTVTELPVAINGRSGHDPVYVDVVCWGRTAEACGTHLRKGRLVGVTGRLDLSRWTDEAGVAHQRHRIVATDVDFLDRPADRSDT